MLLSYLAAIHPPLRMIKGIIMAEKNKSINWSHVDGANADVHTRQTVETSSGCEGRNPEEMLDTDLDTSLAAIPITVWKGADIHNPHFLQRLYEIDEEKVEGGKQQQQLEQEKHQPGKEKTTEGARKKFFCVVGIHLCRRLSSRFIELVNALGDRCMFAALAPVIK